MKRESKILLVILAFVFTFSALISIILPYRATTDEARFLIDLHTLLNTGSLTDRFRYFNGSAHQLLITQLVILTGITPMETEFLSPIIGSIALSTILLIFFFIYREAVPNRPWWGFLTFSPAPFIFAGFINRLRETSHKAFTFTLIFLCLLIGFYQFIDRTDPRLKALALTNLMVISLYNYIWAVVYGVVIGVVFMVGSNRRRIISFLPVGFLTAYVVADNLPTVWVHKQYFKSILVGIFAIVLGFGVPTPSGGSKAGGGLLAGWPQITIGSISVSLWFVCVIGIGFIFTLTGLGCFHAIAYRLSHQDWDPIGQMLVVVNIVTGISAVFVLAAGDIATFKRLIVIPGLFGVLYTVVYFSQHGYRKHLTEHRCKILLSSIFVVLLISSVLALPRVLTDGSISPVDTYVEQDEISKIEWLSSYSEGCVKTHSRIDNFLMPRIAGVYPEISPINRHRSQVYSAGEGAVLTCGPP
ncbi:hypothetical protein ACFFQF_29310 [Haladaptatus pallidirubidus]|uniref:hypothetical protein n=1 Tax=Haladaptatus pallidirubidus TaxID=1008152 RepID=UPI0035EC912B